MNQSHAHKSEVTSLFRHASAEEYATFVVISSKTWRVCIINLAQGWLEERVKAIFEQRLSHVNWRDILSHLFGAVQK